jgi:hypothetical protein
VLVAVTLAFILIGGLGFSHQLVQLANNLPAYQTTITQKDLLRAKDVLSYESLGLCSS